MSCPNALPKQNTLVFDFNLMQRTMRLASRKCGSSICHAHAHPHT